MVPVNPQPEVGINRILGVDAPVAICVVDGQRVEAIPVRCRRLVRGTAKELLSVIDPAIPIAIQDKKRIASP